MKKIILYYILYFCLFDNIVLSDVNRDLQKRLSKLNSFQADFSQKAVGHDGELIQEGIGYL